MSYFKVSEFAMGMIPVEVADKILEHIHELNPVREKLGMPIFVTSGYRTVLNELSKGRSGESQHTTGGAVDLHCQDMKRLIELLKGMTTYTRISYYPDKKFVHCDWKFPDRGRRYFVEWKEERW
jgi:uncharacterized protein YcbK (DUF882 family)